MIIAVMLTILVIKNRAVLKGSAPLLLAILMLASIMFLTKTTARYSIYGVVFLILSVGIISRKVKWFTIGIFTFTAVFAMHGLLVYYTGNWLQIYPAMSPSIPINGLVLSLYQSDIILSEMILLNILAFSLLLIETFRKLRRRKSG